MKGTFSAKQGNKVELELENKPKEDESHVSGAYIRTLVKQLTSSRTKDGNNRNQNSANNEPVQHKKQVRRRLHTSRPYQERLLNMAEARREIVTALKFHRAAMKQQQQERELLQTQQEQEAGKLSKSWRNQRTYPSSNQENFSSPPLPHPHYPYSYPIPSEAPPDNLNFQLPNQTLGLNLNLHHFNNLDTTPYFDNNNNNHNFPIEDLHYTGSTEKPNTQPNTGLHPVMDDKEMAEMRTIGEQHQMEWNDTLNFMTSAWWFKFLKAMEIGPGEEQNCSEDYGCYPFHEVMEFPAWLNANESCCFSDANGYLQDPALPCMEIEEIEGMDVDWLA